MTGGRLAELIDEFSGLRALVVGDAMHDSYLEGSSSRLSQEAPVPVVSVAGRRDLPGGAANTAANVRALGAEATLLAVAGDDLDGGLLEDALSACGVRTDGLLVEPGRRTLVKSRVVSGGQMLVRFDAGDTGAADEHALAECLGELASEADAILVSDYGYGVVTDGVVRALGMLQEEAPRVLVVDAKEPLRFRDAHVTAVKPNRAQALALLGAVDPLEHGERILDLTGAQIAAVTLDSEGALVFERGRPAYRTYARPGPDSRAMGAGDTFAAALALALAAGADMPSAAELASAAAGIVVGKRGTSLCSLGELREHVAGRTKVVPGRRELAALLDVHREHGRTIVFTNGCFDILHRGHITYLSRAKTLGDVLVVGLNSDASVRRLKGDSRPVNPLEDRAHVLAALSAVDHIVPFDEETPVELVRAVRPDVFVKGGDYTRAMLPEAPLVESLGGRVELLPYVEDRSTSGIIDRIRQAERSARR